MMRFLWVWNDEVVDTRLHKARVLTADELFRKYITMQKYIHYNNFKYYIYNYNMSKRDYYNKKFNYTIYG